MNTRFLIRYFMGALLMVVLFEPCAIAQEGAVDLTFNPNDPGFGAGDGPNNTVNAIALQSDGRCIIGGIFTNHSGVVRNRFARLTIGGSVDNTFVNGTGANGAVNSIAIQPDGKILIAGAFTTCNGTTRNRIARTNPDGSVDTGFDPVVGPNGAVSAMALEPGGKIIIGGSFTTVNGTARNRIARLNADGTLDSTFDPGTGMNDAVTCLKIRADGKVVVGGSFTQVNGTSRPRIALLTTSGSLDAGFTTGTGPNNSVFALAMLSGDKVLIAGTFTTVAGVARTCLAKLNANGTVDNTFSDPAFGNASELYAVGVQADGRIIAAGSVRLTGLTEYRLLTRVTANGTQDPAFTSAKRVLPGAGSYLPNALVVQPDDKIFLGGSFVDFGGTGQANFVRANADGTADATFNTQTGANSTVRDIAVMPDGRAVLVGAFNGYNGVLHRKLARVLADGAYDPSFNAGEGAWALDVNQCALQADGKLLLAGRFSTINGITQRRLARLNLDGSVDAQFQMGTGITNDGTTDDYFAYLNAVAIAPDGKILIGGPFNYYNGASSPTMSRLNSDGTRDGSFTGYAVSTRQFVFQPDGKILVVNGGTTTLIRLNQDGTPDPSFTFGGTFAQCAAITASGKILVGTLSSLLRLNADGSLDPAFTAVPGSVSDILVQPDGRFIAAGASTKRYLPDGTLDATFTAGGSANSVAIQPDGKLLVACGTSYNGVGRNRITRLTGTARAGIKLMLEGPYSAGMMNDALRTLPSFPLTEPFTAIGYAETGYVGGATIGSSVLTTNGNNAIVDWVIVEMRPVATPGTVAASRAVLLQRDGDVVDLDGVSTVGFAGLAAGNYCVAVKLRNHLPVMLSATTPVSYGTAVATVDFTLPTTQVYDNDARKNVSGVMVLAAGDMTFNEAVGYTGAGNDRDPILTRVGSTTPNATVAGYWREDLNMDGVVKYTGSANDRDIILTNVGSTTPNNTRVATLP